MDYSIDRYVSGVLVDQWKYGSLGEMLDTLEYLDFNELVSYTDDQIALFSYKSDLGSRSPSLFPGCYSSAQPRPFDLLL